MKGVDPKTAGCGLLVALVIAGFAVREIFGGSMMSAGAGLVLLAIALAVLAIVGQNSKFGVVAGALAVVGIGLGLAAPRTTPSASVSPPPHATKIVAAVPHKSPALRNVQREEPVASVAPAHASAADEREYVRQLILIGDELVERASEIVDHTPKNSMEAAYDVSGDEGPAGRFYVDERAYQDRLQSRKIVAFKDNLAFAADFTIVGIDPFLYGAVQEAMSCNAEAARANLRVAKAILAESHREINGTLNPDWAPPEIDPPEGTCPEE